MNKFVKKYTFSAIFWVLAVILAVLCLPNMNQLITQKGQITIPAKTQSQVANNIQKHWGHHISNTDQTVLVYDAGKRKINSNDQKNIDKTTNKLKGNSDYYGIKGMTTATENADTKKEMISKDGTTELVQLNTTKSQPVSSINKKLEKGAKTPGLSSYVTGSAVMNDDFTQSIAAGIKKTEVIATIFILLVLIIVFRSPVVPLISLLTVGVTFIVSLSIVMNLGKYAGFPLSNFTQVFMVVVLFGIGTDYNILLYDKFKDNLGKGMDKVEATVDARKVAGKTILYSGCSLLIGFSALGLAKFSVYRSGVAVAVGVLVLLIVLLTLNPFFMAVLGKKMYWPTKNFAEGKRDSKIWGFLSSKSVKHPFIAIGAVLLVTLPFIVFGNNKLNYDVAVDLGNSMPAKQGLNIVQHKFSKGLAEPSTIYIKSDKPLDNQESMAQIDRITRQLARRQQIQQIASVTEPGGNPLQQLYLNYQLGALNKGMGKASKGLKKMQREVNAPTPSFDPTNLESIGTSTQAIGNSAKSIGASTQAIGNNAQAVGTSTKGIGNNAQAIGTATQGVGNSAKSIGTSTKAIGNNAQSIGGHLRTVQGMSGGVMPSFPSAGPSLSGSAILGGMQQKATMARQPMTPAQLQIVGGGLQGINNSVQAKQAAAQAQANGYARTAQQKEAGVKNQLTGVAGNTQGIGRNAESIGNHTRRIGNNAEVIGSNTKQIGSNAENIGNNTKQIGSNAENIGNNTKQIGYNAENIGNSTKGVVTQLQTMQTEAQAKQAKANAGLTKLNQGMDQSNQYLTELQKSPVSADTFYIPNQVIQSGAFAPAINTYLSQDKKTASIVYSVNDNPLDANSMNLVNNVQNQVKQSLRGTSLGNAQVAIGGETATMSDTKTIASNDFARTAIIMLVGIGIALMFVTRSILQAFYIEGTLLLSYLTSMSLTQLFSKAFLGQSMLTWNTPFFIFIMLIALGVDYSIFLMMKYRELDDGTPSERIVSAAKYIGVVVLSAAIILGGTFASLIPSGILTLIQVAIGVVFGLIILVIILPILLPAAITLTYGHEKQHSKK